MSGGTIKPDITIAERYSQINGQKTLAGLGRTIKNSNVSNGYQTLDKLVID